MIRANALRLFDPAAEIDFAHMTLREVFEAWFLPSVLSDPLERPRPVSLATVAIYRDALQWWERCTRNAPAGMISDVDAVAFLEGLAKTPYRRRKFGGDRFLSPSSRAKHVASIRAILNRLTPNDRGVSLDVLEKRVRLKKPAVNCLPKATPSLATLQKTMGWLANAGEACLFPAPPGSRPAHWWRALLGTLYAHGWRLQTALGLRKEFIVAEEVMRLRVPGEASVKTHKAGIRPIPPWLKALWDAAECEGPSIHGRPARARRLLDCFYEIQVAAGVAGRHSFQSLRRLHAAECGRVGFDLASSLSRDALQHSSVEITRSHYADLLEAAILRLPPLE
jgi:hypothetical protein